MAVPDYNFPLENKNKKQNDAGGDSWIKSKKQDKIGYGLLLGLIIPFAGVGILYGIMFRNNYTFGEFMQRFSFTHHYSSATASKVLGLGTLFNLVPFYIFLNRKYYNIARGVIAATLVYCVLFGIYRFFLS